MRRGKKVSLPASSVLCCHACATLKFPCPYFSVMLAPKSFLLSIYFAQQAVCHSACLFEMPWAQAHAMPLTQSKQDGGGSQALPMHAAMPGHCLPAAMALPCSCCHIPAHGSVACHHAALPSCCCFALPSPSCELFEGQLLPRPNGQMAIYLPFTMPCQSQRGRSRHGPGHTAMSLPVCLSGSSAFRVSTACRFMRLSSAHVTVMFHRLSPFTSCHCHCHCLCHAIVHPVHH